jgi:hypothetical protein
VQRRTGSLYDLASNSGGASVGRVAGIDDRKFPAGVKSMLWRQGGSIKGRTYQREDLSKGGPIKAMTGFLPRDAGRISSDRQESI